MPSITATGKFEVIFDKVQATEKFAKREFVLAVDEVGTNGNTYTQLIKFQCTNNKIPLLDKYRPGLMATVHFNIKGNKWERDGKVMYLLALEVWKIEG